MSTAVPLGIGHASWYHRNAARQSANATRQKQTKGLAHVEVPTIDLHFGQSASEAIKAGPLFSPLTTSHLAAPPLEDAYPIPLGLRSILVFYPGSSPRPSRSQGRWWWWWRRSRRRRSKWRRSQQRELQEYYKTSDPRLERCSGLGPKGSRGQISGDVLRVREPEGRHHTCRTTIRWPADGWRNAE